MVNLTLYQGDSYTVAIKFNDDYDVSRIQALELNIGSKLVGSLSENIIKKDGLFILEIPSEKTMLLRGQTKLTLHIEDSILGVKKQVIASLGVKFSHNKTNNTSTNKLYDALFNINIGETQVTAEHVLFNAMKGEKGDMMTYESLTNAQKQELKDAMLQGASESWIKNW